MAALSAEFGDDLAILAFPTGEFGGQELPTDDAIADFAHGRMNFPQPPRGVLLQKKNLGDREAWQAMQFESGAAPPTWNFGGSFLVSRDGKVSDASGVDLSAALKELL